MIRPIGFKANVETIEDNYFQHPNDLEDHVIESRAIEEFEGVIKQLKNNDKQQQTKTNNNKQ